MRQPNSMIMSTIKSYAKTFLNENYDTKHILFTKKSLIEHHKGQLLNSDDIINALTKTNRFDWIWEVTNEKYYTNYLSEDGYKCYELIEDLNGWDATLIILPPYPTHKQRQEWNRIDKFISNMGMRYVMW